MPAHILPALIVFGLLLVIAVLGLLRASAAATRLRGSTNSNSLSTGLPTGPRPGAAYPDSLRR